MLPGSLLPHKSFSPLITIVMKLCFLFFSLSLIVHVQLIWRWFSVLQWRRLCCPVICLYLYGMIQGFPQENNDHVHTVYPVLLSLLEHSTVFFLSFPLDGGYFGYIIKRWITDNKAHQRQQHNLETMTGL